MRYLTEITFSTLAEDQFLQSQNSPQPPGQYCAPDGACDLGNLDNGVSGFVLQGQAASDWSGYSVSSAGDINGDGLADILVGAPDAFPSGVYQAGKTYVVFGSNQTNAWGMGTVNLTSLINDQRGFVLQGEAAGDVSGRSVSSATQSQDSAAALYCDLNGACDLSNLDDGILGFVLQG